MTKPGDAILGLALIIVALGASAFGIESCGRHKVEQGTTQAVAAQAQAQVHQAQAEQSDGKVEALKAQLVSVQGQVAKARRERDEALARPLPVPPPPEVVQILVKDTALIEAQDKQIQEQVAVIGQLTVSRDEWKATAEAERRRAAGLEIALEGQKAASKGGRVVGTLQGVAIGFGVGFLAGRWK